MQGIPIAISQRIYLSEFKETRDTLDQRYCEFASQIGGIPFPIPNNLGLKIENWLKIISPKAIILSGGNDIGTFGSRDKTEFLLIKYSLKNSIPILGICRGLQMLIKYEKGNLIKVENHINVRHAIFGESVSKGELPKFVNSFHNWGLKVCPDKFQVLARAEDQTIEAVKHENSLWEGWMWHPEREFDFAIEDLCRAKKLFKTD